MADAFRDGRCMDCFGIVEEGRVRKSPVEIEVMGRAARATEAGMRAGLDAVAPGVTENEIAAAISAAMFRAGGELPAVMPYVTSGPRTHDRPRHLGGPHRPARRARLHRGRRLLPPLPHRDDAHGRRRRAVTSMMLAQERMKHCLDEMHATVRPGLTDRRRRPARALDHHRQRGGRQARHPRPATRSASPSRRAGTRATSQSIKPGDNTVLEGGHDLPRHPLDVGRGRRQDGRHLRHHPRHRERHASRSSRSTSDFTVVAEAGASEPEPSAPRS